MPPTHRFKSLFGCGATPDGAWTVRGKIRNDVRLKDDDHCYCTEIICTVVCCVCRCVLSHGAVSVCLWATLVCLFLDL